MEEDIIDYSTMKIPQGFQVCRVNLQLYKFEL